MAEEEERDRSRSRRCSKENQQLEGLLGRMDQITLTVWLLIHVSSCFELLTAHFFWFIMLSCFSSSLDFWIKDLLALLIFLVVVVLHLGYQLVAKGKKRLSVLLPLQVPFNFWSFGLFSYLYHSLISLVMAIGILWFYAVRVEDFWLDILRQVLVGNENALVLYKPILGQAIVKLLFMWHLVHML